MKSNSLPELTVISFNYNLRQILCLAETYRLNLFMIVPTYEGSKDIWPHSEHPLLALALIEELDHLRRGESLVYQKFYPLPDKWIKQIRKIIFVNEPRKMCRGAK